MNLKLFSAVVFLGCAVGLSASAQQHSVEFKIRPEEFHDRVLGSTIIGNANYIFRVIHQAWPDSEELSFAEERVTNDGANALVDFWGGSPFYCTKAGSLRVRILSTADGYEIRDIPICRAKADMDKDRFRDVVIRFDKSGKVSGFTVAMQRNTYRDIMNHYDAESVADKAVMQKIISEIENFETAYNTKDSVYLDAIYSDDALIITGNVVQRISSDGVAYNDIRYKQSSKQEYMKNLRRVFRNNEWINIKLTLDGPVSDAIVRSVVNPDMYGVSLYQKWDSETYSDEGYLFLLFEIHDVHEPFTIWVRNWMNAYTYDKNGKKVPVEYEPWEKFTIDDVRIRN
ncbi:MAG TPA: hypothetical protein IAC03_02885 [Candidatus Coprenecus pullistercoris]|nr:hypothetical protein [Candidatus Coprenecus pullistercoris]